LLGTIQVNTSPSIFPMLRKPRKLWYDSHIRSAIKAHAHALLQTIHDKILAKTSLVCTHRKSNVRKSLVVK
jgi:hypothetical protein